MNVRKAQKKEEAIRRMKIIGLFDDMIKHFEDDNIIYVNEPPIGAIYDLSEEDMEMVRKFEEKYNALVYTVIRSYTTMGTMDVLMYVADEISEWAMDTEDLEENTAFAYVVNHNFPLFSEFGQIHWKRTAAGGIIRVE